MFHPSSMRLARFGTMFFLLLLCYSARPQVLMFNHLSTKDGLASNIVHCLWQDKKGFLWIGTSNGLQRYDGYHFFSPYYNDAASRLPQLPVQQIVEDNMGRVWLRMGQTIGIFDPVTFRFTEVPVLISGHLTDVNWFVLQKDSRGNVFVLIYRFGWLFFDPASFTLREDVAPFVIPRSFEMTSVLDDPKTGRWLIGGRGGLVMYDKNTKQLYNYNNNAISHPLLKDPRLHNQPVGNFYIDRKRRYWFTCWPLDSEKPTFYCFDERKQTYIQDTMGLAAFGKRGYFELHQFTEFSDTSLLAYGLNCMAVRDSGRFIPIYNLFNSPYDIDFNIVNATLEDREKILWVATDNGLYCSMTTAISSGQLILQRAKGKAEITSLLETGTGSLWIGTWGRGVLVKQANDPRKEAYDIYKNAPADNSYKLTWDMQQHSLTGRIWVGCQQGKLIVYDTAAKHSSFIAPSVFEHKTIRQVAEDANGNLWFGTQGGLLIRWNKGSSLHDSAFHLVQKLPASIFRLYVDKKGLLWIAIAGFGVQVVDAATGQIIKKYDVYETKEKIFGNHVRDILQLNDSIYAFAADGLDLLNYRTGTITRVGNNNHWPVGPVISMQADNYNQLWLSTPTSLYKYTYPANFFIRYNQWDGLITVYNRSFQLETSLKQRNGFIIFAGNENLVAFDPSDYRVTSAPPDVTIGGFKLFNDYLPVDSLMHLKKVKLNYNQNSISIEFASLSFRQINKLSYYYKLEGADQDWQRLEDRLQVSFKLLPPGEYKFLVRACNEEGKYSRITSLPFTILPPFWQTWWFYSVILLLAAALLYYLYRVRINRLLHVEKIRSRLARDLHDDMGSTLSTINILSNIAVKKISTDQEASKEYMNRISNSSSRIMEAMDDIVWSINPVNDSMRKITARMKEFAGSLLEASDIEYTFQVNEDVKEMSFDMEWRREIFLIFKEAVTNIVKYARCTHVNISIYKQKKIFIMVIADNGVGFNNHNGQSAAVRGNGVKNMRKRAEAMEGSLEISSFANSGTTLELRVPLT
jgi:signal transduction histidine kinase/ligand-binding sensor domain-containing protein